MGKKKYDDICKPLKEFYRRIIVIDTDNKKYAKLVKDSGYAIRFCGRKIGISNVNGKWRATDLATGIRIGKKEYKYRAGIITFLMKNKEHYKKAFKEQKDRLDEWAKVFDNLYELYKYGKGAKLK